MTDMKISKSALLTLFLVNSPHARVSYSRGWGSSSWIATMERGHGTKSNPRASVGEKLLSDELIAGQEHWDLHITAEGRKVLDAYRAEGWELRTGTGHKPYVEQIREGE